MLWTCLGADKQRKLKKLSTMCMLHFNVSSEIYPWCITRIVGATRGAHVECIPQCALNKCKFEDEKKILEKNRIILFYKFLSSKYLDRSWDFMETLYITQLQIC